MNRPTCIAWLDLETTGLDHERHEIIEIGIVRTSLDGRIVEDVLDLKVRPSHQELADPKALEVNGYNEGDWRWAVSLEEGYARASTILAGAMIGGHNVGFDVRFLEAAAGVLGEAPTWSHRRVDTQSLAWPLLAAGLIENTSLDEICRALGVRRPSPHRAMVDALASREVALAMLPRFDLGGLR